MRNGEGVEKKPKGVSDPSARRPASVRIRTAAAGSFLAAASAAGLGTAGAAPARAAESSPVTVPFSADTADSADTVDAVDTVDAGARAGAELLGDAAPLGDAQLPQAARERLAGIRADLGNAVQWGSVTQTQAEGFYAQIHARILRGL